MRRALLVAVSLVLGFGCGEAAAPPTLASIAVSLGTSTVIYGKTTTAVAAGVDEKGQPMALDVVTWTTDNPLVATVTHEGVVTARGIGATLIVATAGGRQATATVTVIRPPVASIAVTPGDFSISVGQVRDLVAANTLDADGNSLGRAVTWTSSSPAVADFVTTPVGTRFFTALSLGTTTVTATSEGITASMTVVVVPAIATIAIAPADITLLRGASNQLTATLRDGAGNILTGRTVEWSSSRSSWVTVSPTGLATAVGAGGGTALITASSEGKKVQTGRVAVAEVPLKRVDITPVSNVLNVGRTSQLTATVIDANGQAFTGATFPTIVWASDNASVTVSQTGLATAVSPGSATISATVGGKVGAVTVTVTPP